MDFVKLITFIKRFFDISIQIDYVEFYKWTDALVFNILKPRNYRISVSPVVYICFFLK